MGIAPAPAFHVPRKVQRRGFGTVVATIIIANRQIAVSREEANKAMTSRVLIVAILVLLTTPIHAAGPLADTVKPPPECASAKNANECADILKKLGKNPFVAFGYVGREPVYGGQNETPTPPCKSGAPSCNPWERDWSNTSLPPGTIVTDQGAILPPPPQRPFPWNYLYDWQTLIAGLAALLAAVITVWVTLRVERGKARREVDALRKSLAVEFRLQIARAFGAYDGLRGLGSNPDEPITARMVESKSRMAAPIIYPANAGKIGLL